VDVLTQALDVVQRAEADSGRVTLTLDLDRPGQRAAYAAAIAVLRISGVDFERLSARHDGDDAAADGAADDARDAAGAAGGESGETGNDGSAGAAVADDNVAPLLRSYAEAIGELTPDESRQKRIVKATFSRVRDLLLDGANVEAVAQVQYHRWMEEQSSTSNN
jgi:hypothetical protein